MIASNNLLLQKKIILVFAFVWILVTAYQSVGFFHADEHYQLLEFAGLKLGYNTTTDLTWEFDAQIRPSFQPYIAYVLISGLKWVGINNPFNQAFVLRAITGVCFYFSVFFFWKKTKHRFNGQMAIWYLVISFFIWFYPYIYVRFSSETWSAFTFLLGVSFLYDNKKRSYVVLGALFFGLSIVLRIQTITMVFGFFMWTFFIKKESLKQLTYWVLPIVVVFGLSVLLDHLFYGEPVFTSWNYLRVNLFESKAAEFGVSPWYSYLHYILKYGYGPFGVIIILSFFYLLFTKPKDPFIWIVFPLFFIHSLIGHKELRFLFPALPFIPIIVITSIHMLDFNKYYLKYGLYILCLINVVGLVLSSLKPARHGKVKLVEEIVTLKNGEIIIISTPTTNPFDPWGLPLRFYYHQEYTDIQLDKVENLETITLSNQRYFLTLKKKEVTDASLEVISRMGFVKYAESTPPWMDAILNAYGSFNVDQKVILFVREAGKSISQ